MSLLYYNYNDSTLGLVPSFNANIVYGSMQRSKTGVFTTNLSGNKNMIDVSNNGLLCKKEGIYKIRITLQFSESITDSTLTFSIAEARDASANTDILPIYTSLDVFEEITQQCILSLGYLYSTGTAVNYTFTIVVDTKYYVPTINIPASNLIITDSSLNGLSVIEAMLYLKKDTKPIYFNVLPLQNTFTSTYNYIIESMLFIDPIPDISILDDGTIYNMKNSGIQKVGLYSYIEFTCSDSYYSDAKATIKFNKTIASLGYILIGGGGGGGNSRSGDSGTGGGGGGVVNSSLSVTTSGNILIQVGRGAPNVTKGGDSSIKRDTSNVATATGGHAGTVLAVTNSNLNDPSNTTNPTTGGSGTSSRSTTPGYGGNGYTTTNPFGVTYLSSGAGGGGDITGNTTERNGGQGGQNATGGQGGDGQSQTSTTGGNGTGYGAGGGGGGVTLYNTPKTGNGGYGSPGLVVLYWLT